jgi:hypothetical protein
VQGLKREIRIAACRSKRINEAFRANWTLKERKND